MAHIVHWSVRVQEEVRSVATEFKQVLFVCAFDSNWEWFSNKSMIECLCGRDSDSFGSFGQKLMTTQALPQGREEERSGKERQGEEDRQQRSKRNWGRHAIVWIMQWLFPTHPGSTQAHIALYAGRLQVEETSQTSQWFRLPNIIMVWKSHHNIDQLVCFCQNSFML